MVGIRPVFVIAAISLGLLPAVLFGSAAAISFARRAHFARGLHSVAEGE
jgi:hypothetical protein